jgi:hypothetical protein
LGSGGSGLGSLRAGGFLRQAACGLGRSDGGRKLLIGISYCRFGPVNKHNRVCSVREGIGRAASAIRRVSVPSIYIYKYYLSFYVMDSFIYHMDQSINQMIYHLTVCASVPYAPASVKSRTPALFFQAARLHVLQPRRRGHDRANRAHLHVAQSFFIFARSFYYFINHELNHFTYVN